MENDFRDAKILHFNLNGAPYIRIKTPAVYLCKCEIITNISLYSSIYDVFVACIYWPSIVSMNSIPINVEIHKPSVNSSLKQYGELCFWTLEV